MNDEHRSRHLIEKRSRQRPLLPIWGVASAQDHEIDLVAFSPKTDLLSGSALDDISRYRYIGIAFSYKALDLFVRFPSPDVPLERVGRYVARSHAFQDANDRQSPPECAGDGERVWHDQLAHRRSVDASGDMSESHVSQSL
ncbi:MAG: hypothetical protein WEB50_12720 [Vicinamibacterales bacterium]